MIYLRCPECGATTSKAGFSVRGQCCLCGWQNPGNILGSKPLAAQVMSPFADVYCHPDDVGVTREHLAEHEGSYELHKDPMMARGQICMRLRTSGYARTWVMRDDESEARDG